jgi:hypothetical protein
MANLDEQQIEALRTQHGGKVAVIDWGSHQLVFKRPSRDSIRDYRRKIDSPAEKPDATDQLAQVTIVAIDGETDGDMVRARFLKFLDEYPLFTSGGRCMVAMNILTGMASEEEFESLGKGVSVKSSAPRSTPPA